MPLAHKGVLSTGATSASERGLQGQCLAPLSLFADSAEYTYCCLSPPVSLKDYLCAGILNHRKTSIPLHIVMWRGMLVFAVLMLTSSC